MFYLSGVSNLLSNFVVCSIFMTRKYYTSANQETCHLTEMVSPNPVVLSFYGASHMNGGIYFGHYKPTPGRRYRVTMYDSAQNGWSSGSYVEVHMCGVRKVHATLVSGGSDAVDFYASFVCCH